MNQLVKKILEKIRNEGPITFETFMDMALYEPGLGYYASGKIEIGKAGDYYTSQHLHPIFGALLGRQLEEMWEIMGKPSVFHAIEPGAGTGHLCMDLLNYLAKKELYDSLRYVIVELHPSMREKQQKLLSGFSHKVKWVSALEEMGSISGCILSNELLDAFPVHLVEMEENLREVYVSAENERFEETKGDLSTPALSGYLKEFSLSFPPGYRTEINLRIKEWLRAVSGVLSEGFLITIDYGHPSQEYYSEERNRGTLMCYFRHQVNEDPFSNAGDQDITAHINFSSVKKWGEEYGFRTLGFCRQGTYLVSLGIDEMIAELYKNSKDYLFEVAKIKRLILPGTLGETHNVLIQYKGNKAPTLRGFSLKNQMRKL
ncbi:MAG: SAM-dependent methyltransferase [Thermodesulfovibrionales bacterium]|nr:SAM-dependent methyltransferase [Thermodesulfovibrionales bacterium]